MNATLKRVMALCLVIIVCVHFIILFIYASPIKSISKKISNLTMFYTNPVFHQNWNLFVPAPKNQHYLFVRHKMGDNWSNWTDILQVYVEKNQHNRFMGNDMLVLLFSNSLIYFINTLPQQSTLYQKMPVSMQYIVLNHEISRYMQENEHIVEHTDYELLILSSGKTEHTAWYIQSLKTIK